MTWETTEGIWVRGRRSGALQSRGSSPLLQRGALNGVIADGTSIASFTRNR